MSAPKPLTTEHVAQHDAWQVWKKEKARWQTASEADAEEALQDLPDLIERVTSENGEANSTADARCFKPPDADQLNLEGLNSKQRRNLARYRMHAAKEKNPEEQESTSVDERTTFGAKAVELSEMD